MRILASSLAFSEVITEVKELSNLTIPLIIGNILIYTKSAISMVFMGYLGKEALAGGSLAIGFANITAYSVLFGLAMGMDSIISQAYGAKQWILIGQTLQRTILILLISCIPISILWFHVQPILVMLGQDPTISSIASIYLTYSIPDLILITFINPLKIYLRCQKVTYPFMISVAIALSFHWPINYLLVTRLGLGIKGVAFGCVIMDLNILLAMVVYIYISGIHKKTWDGWSSECFKGWSSILNLAIPSCVSICLEWWWYEFMIILSGWLPDAKEAVATMGILIQATSLVYIFPSSLSLAVSTQVGNELGTGRPDKAKVASIISICGAFLMSIVALTFSCTMTNQWGRAFTSDEAIIALTSSAMPLLGLCELGNCPQTTMCGVLRGSARPKLGAQINVGSFYGVGLPIAIIFMFFMHKGLVGLWIGLFGAQITCAIWLFIILVKTDWDDEANRAKELTNSNNNVTSFDLLPMVKNGGFEVENEGDNVRFMIE